MIEHSLRVLHDSNHLLVVDKPACTPTVPDDSRDTSLLELAKAWVKEHKNKPGDVYLGVVHRLDRPVGGVLCFARTSKAAARVTSAFHDRRVEKRYLAVVEAHLEGAGELEQWLIKRGSKNVVRVVPEGTEGARRALTHYRPLKHSNGRTLVELKPVTGRPHQLRVAMATLGHTIVGDLKYGAKAPLPDRSIALHAQRLVLPHPTRDERITVESKPPAIGDWRLF